MAATKLKTVNWVGSWWGVFFASLSAIFWGAALGCDELIFRKVDVLDGATIGKVPMNRAFALGNDFMGDNWQQKLSTMATAHPAHLTINEGDLNLFLKNSMAQKPSEISTTTATSSVQVVPNARISGNRLRLGLLAYSNFRKDPLCLQVSGIFERGDDGFYYSVRRAYVGALPIPGFIARPAMAILLHRTFSDPSAQPLVKAWQELKDVTIENGALRLVWR